MCSRVSRRRLGTPLSSWIWHKTLMEALSWTLENSKNLDGVSFKSQIQRSQIVSVLVLFSLLRMSFCCLEVSKLRLTYSISQTHSRLWANPVNHKAPNQQLNREFLLLQRSLRTKNVISAHLLLLAMSKTMSQDCLATIFTQSTATPRTFMFTL